MTNKEKINLQYEVIKKLYVEEGRSKSYISRLLDIDRKTLSVFITEQNWIQGKNSYLTPSNQKFINKHRQYIKSQLDKNVSINDIARSLNKECTWFGKMIKKDKVLLNAVEEYKNRMKDIAEDNKERKMSESRFQYSFESIQGESWKPILGYDGYYVSNMGRVKVYIKKYDAFALRRLTINTRTKRQYIHIGRKCYSLPRIVAHAFVDGYSEDKNTVNHIDGDIENNKASNLEWVSQSENNKKAYNLGKKVSIPYSKSGKFKKIILDDKFEFKSICSLSKFMDVSETQVARYIHGECQTDHSFKILY